MLELFTLDGFEPVPRLAQQQDLLGVVDIFDQVVHPALVVERIVEVELALATRLVDQGDVLWVFFVFSQASVSAGGRDDSEATS